MSTKYKNFKNDVEFLKNFMPAMELRTIVQNTNGEEGEFFVEKIQEMADRIRTMPKTYEQDGKGDGAVAYLHYFKGGDWYITEKDAGSPDDEVQGVQQQAFGLANLGYGAELGYISIEELINAGVELDLYFTPKPLREIKQRG